MAPVTFDIIIPHYGFEPRLRRLCRNCLLTIIKFSQNYRVILIDNGSDDAVDVYELLSRCRAHVLVRNRSNLGFVRAVNQGFALATAPYVVVMNNDTEATANWLPKLQAAFVLRETIAAVGPKTTAKSWQGRTPWTGPARVLKRDAMLAFFCTMFRRDAVEKIGDLDESFGVGLGDDSDYCRRLHKAGYRLAFVPDVTIPHHHRSTFHALYGVHRVSEMQDAALARYKEKWPD